jgi:hypothetical protein
MVSPSNIFRFLIDLKIVAEATKQYIQRDRDPLGTPLMATPATDSDRNDLVEFLDGTRYVLQNLTDARSICFREQLRVPIANAWRDVHILIEDAQSTLAIPDPKSLSENRQGQSPFCAVRRAKWGLSHFPWHFSDRL